MYSEEYFTSGTNATMTTVEFTYAQCALILVLFLIRIDKDLQFVRNVILQWQLRVPTLLIEHCHRQAFFT